MNEKNLVVTTTYYKITDEDGNTHIGHYDDLNQLIITEAANKNVIGWCMNTLTEVESVFPVQQKIRGMYEETTYDVYIKHQLSLEAGASDNIHHSIRDAAREFEEEFANDQNIVC